jgi:hypothetical protein
MAVEQQLRIQEDTATAKRNLYCEVGANGQFPS